MNKTKKEKNKINHTSIEWVKNPDGTQGYSLNPIKGLCPIGCSYCYAAGERGLYKRFKWNPEIRYQDPFWEFYSLKRKPPARVFIGSTIELFGDWIKPEWMYSILSFCSAYPQHTFIFLTKKPENLIRWNPFPDNCWIGVSVTTKVQLRPAIWGLTEVQCNKRFLSLEPLLENVLDQVLPAEWDDAIDWVIVGQRTPVSKSTLPKLKWIARIEASCKVANIPLFLKNNLKPLLGNNLRQEFPHQ